MRLSGIESLFLIWPLIFILFWLILIVVHVVFAAAVFKHSTSARDAGYSTVFVRPEFWALATLATGVVGATGYWLLHCSSLATPQALVAPHAPAVSVESAVPPA
jgi:hypothetical protein